MTEFHYRIFEGPELLPVFASVYIDTEEDLINFQRASSDGRYSLTLYTGTKGGFTRSRSIARIYIVDNYPKNKNQVRTNKNVAYKFLKSYNMKLVLDGVLADALQTGTGNFYNMQSLYQSTATHN